MLTLRPYQSALVQQWHTSTSRAVVAQLATGGGKTAILAHVVQTHAGPSVVMAHRQELVGQLSQALASYGVEHDLICSAATRRAINAAHILRFKRTFIRPGARCRVASVDTLIRAKGLEQWAAQVTLGVVDEAHHCVRDNKWHTAMGLFTHPALRWLLPTATPWRADGKGLGSWADGVADEMIEGPTARWLTDEGYLTAYRVVCPASDLQVLRDVGASGDWSQSALKEASQRSHIVGDVVAQYLAHARGRLGATFTTDVETATDMAAAYRAAGVPAEVLTGETPDAVRVDVLKRLERRELLQICVVDIISEGFDLPALEVISMARPTASLALYLQQFGRVLRPVFAPGMPQDTAAERIAAQAASPKGRHALLIDHVGNFIRHRGGPDAPRVWTLDARDKRSTGPSDAIPLRVCLACIQPFERVLTACPHCGEPVPAPAGRAAPEQVDGDLALVDEETLAALRAELPLSLAEQREAWMRTGLPDLALRRNCRAHTERLAALDALRAAMAQWAGPFHAAGASDREIQRRFYLTFGVDVLTAMGLKRVDAEALAARVAGA